MNIVAADALAHEPGQLVRFHGLFNGGAVIGAAVAGVVIAARRVVARRCGSGSRCRRSLTALYVVRGARARSRREGRAPVDVARGRSGCATKG